MDYIFNEYHDSFVRPIKRREDKIVVYVGLTYHQLIDVVRKMLIPILFHSLLLPFPFLYLSVFLSHFNFLLFHVLCHFNFLLVHFLCHFNFLLVHFLCHQSYVIYYPHTHIHSKIYFKIHLKISTFMFKDFNTIYNFPEKWKVQIFPEVYFWHMKKLRNNPTKSGLKERNKQIEWASFNYNSVPPGAFKHTITSILISTFLRIQIK